MSDIANSYEHIRQILQRSIDSSPERTKIFFKTGLGEYAESDRFLGITTPTLRKIAKKHLHLSLKTIAQILQSEFNEERLFALIILVLQYQKTDTKHKEDIYQFYLDNLEHVNNWNLVDNSAHHIMGHYLWNNIRLILTELAKSANLWKRRTSIVSTWYFIKQQDFEYTTKIAAILLLDNHDLIHKASGWMLREMGKQDIQTLINFLEQYHNQMPRTMLRYAIEKLPEKMRNNYLTR